MKCVSLDLDGTLLNSKHEITEGTENVLNQLTEKGIDVIINTGRAYKDIVKIKAVDKLKCPIICLNGSMMYSETGEIIYETTLSHSLCEKLISTIRNLGVGVLVYTNQGGFPATLPQLYGKTLKEIHSMFEQQNYQEIFENEDIKIYKMIAWVEESNIERIEDVRIHMKQEESISFSSSHPNNLEITSIEAQKGKAIRRYEQLMNRTYDEIYSFGDGGNDISQFEVSTKSFAMENAPDEVKSKATHITKSNDEDGVVHALKNMLKLV
jgi:5-amino-6-(5-phospho-D-ribitylamino)uracil phosphatase